MSYRTSMDSYLTIEERKKDYVIELGKDFKTVNDRVDLRSHRATLATSDMVAK